MYYLCSENKGADQLRGYREADLRLCFRICKTLVFALRGSNIAVITASKDNDAMANSVDPDQTAPLGMGGYPEGPPRFSRVWVLQWQNFDVKCLAQVNNTVEVGFEPLTSRSGV